MKRLVIILAFLFGAIGSAQILVVADEFAGDRHVVSHHHDDQGAPLHGDACTGAQGGAFHACGSGVFVLGFDPDPFVFGGAIRVGIPRSKSWRAQYIASDPPVPRIAA